MNIVKLYSIALLLLLSGWGCSKQVEPNPLIVGDWQLQESYNWGCFSSGRTFPKPGERTVLRFEPSGLYSTTRNDTLTARGTYKLALGKDNDTGEKQFQLTLNQEPSPSASPDNVLWTQSVYELNTQTLSIGNSFGTGSSGSIYTRIY